MTCLIKIALCLLCFLIGNRTDQDVVDYCKNTICGGSNEHTLCKFSGPSPNCIDFEEIITTRKDKQLVLDKINSRRNKVASGEIRSLPAAESMIKLEWNDELALSAQRWADQCESQNVEDTCRDLENTTVGQNIATVKGESPGLSPHVLVDLWYIQLLNINISLLSSYQSSLETGLQHYDYFTQMVWDTTTAVGCGGVKFIENENKLGNEKKTVYRLVCNFFPSGNLQGREVYATGEPCSQCPVHYSCDSEYPSLCSRDEIETTQSTPKCKDVIAVEEFIRILKNKLNTEQLVRDFLYSTKTSSSDSSPSDEHVKAVVQQIYSKKIPATTTSVTESNHMNSTLLANLVEAIIFRKSDAITTTHTPYADTPTYNIIKPIKIQASLGEVKVNNEFSGHLFFPEEDESEENSETETTESFYDSTDMPASDIAFEIESISKNSRTRNFLDEVLEEELLKEGATEDSPTSTYKENGVRTTIPHPGLYSRKIRRFRRNYENITNNSVIEKRDGGKYMHYFDLLKKIAADLRQLKIREHHSCSSNNSNFKCDNISIFLTCTIMVHTFSNNIL
ncbi:peptidase inhibitor 16-like isoform X2 [Aricia agestis]|uniref:peptidase inhibitor 16-like isoform X2 n=1 Tax=Aricia agestis TaxID=91739 RepID=UPI001C202AEC|nr:peptidase inhibitor 16-like isoform X2 [Aricia agestis]